MLEKEIKVLEIDVEEVCKKLEELGAKRSFEGTIHDVYYDFPEDSGDLKMENNERLFRVRKKWEDHIYTIKRKRKNINKEEGVNAKDEHETRITDVESFSKVLEKYGMKKTREKLKHRISYELAGAEFDIDKYDEIPAVLEIEEQSGKAIEVWVEKLGLSDHEQMIGGSRRLFKHYGKQYLTFEE